MTLKELNIGESAVIRTVWKVFAKRLVTAERKLQVLWYRK